MAKIIYKKGCEGQNNLSSIEGIEIDLLNGQKALIYPKYSEEMILPYEKRALWEAKRMSEIEALKVEDTNGQTCALLKMGSPAVEWVSQFWSERHSIFCLPSLLAAMEIQHQKKEIDELAETIEGADLLRDFTSAVWSCSRYGAYGCWYANGYGGYASSFSLDISCLVVPIVLYR